MTKSAVWFPVICVLCVLRMAAALLLEKKRWRVVQSTLIIEKETQPFLCAAAHRFLHTLMTRWYTLCEYTIYCQKETEIQLTLVSCA